MDEETRYIWRGEEGEWTGGHNLFASEQIKLDLYFWTNFTILVRSESDAKGEKAPMNTFAAGFFKVLVLSAFWHMAVT